MTAPRSAEEAFRALYAEHGRAILAYAVRRVRDPQDAADAVAGTFLVAAAAASGTSSSGPRRSRRLRCSP
jgi:DNA-directed RNA polymerase specialized sigma24 family protein